MMYQRDGMENDGRPVLYNWYQNSDTTITGFVSNSTEFATGTEMTISPVQNGRRNGAVTTSSGTIYRLL